jgi:hypothetical protein
MTVDPNRTDEETPHHVNHHRLEKFEGGADIAMIAMVIVLGLAMVVGLLTASGSVHF